MARYHRVNTATSGLSCTAPSWSRAAACASAPVKSPSPLSACSRMSLPRISKLTRPCRPASVTISLPTASRRAASPVRENDCIQVPLRAKASSAGSPRRRASVSASAAARPARLPGSPRDSTAIVARSLARSASRPAGSAVSVRSAAAMIRAAAAGSSERVQMAGTSKLPMTRAVSSGSPSFSAASMAATRWLMAASRPLPPVSARLPASVAADSRRVRVKPGAARWYTAAVTASTSSAGESRCAACRRTSASKAASDGPGSRPSSVASSDLARRITSSASAWRPPRYSASASSRHASSRHGCPLTWACRSGTAWAARPSASRAAACRSMRARRSSASRAHSAPAHGSSANSA